MPPNVMESLAPILGIQVVVLKFLFVLFSLTHKPPTESTTRPIQTPSTYAHSSTYHLQPACRSGNPVVSHGQNTAINTTLLQLSNRTLFCPTHAHTGFDSWNNRHHDFWHPKPHHSRHYVQDIKEGNSKYHRLVPAISLPTCLCSTQANLQPFTWSHNGKLPGLTSNRPLATSPQ